MKIYKYTYIFLKLLQRISIMCRMVGCKRYCKITGIIQEVLLFIIIRFMFMSLANIVYPDSFVGLCASLALANHMIRHLRR